MHTSSTHMPQQMCHIVQFHSGIFVGRFNLPFKIIGGLVLRVIQHQFVPQPTNVVVGHQFRHSTAHHQ
jgi:hypothetical protein